MNEYLDIIIIIISIVSIAISIGKTNKRIILLEEERLKAIKEKDAEDYAKLVFELEQKRNPKYCKSCKFYTSNSECEKHNKILFYSGADEEAIVVPVDFLPKVNGNEDYCFEYEEKPKDA